MMLSGSGPDNTHTDHETASALSVGPVVQTRGLTKLYGNEAAVSQLDMSVDEGEIYGFLGPNGAGKTTTILMLLGLSEPDSGTARVLGLDPTREPVAVKRQVACLPESVGFYRDLTGRQNLRFVARLNGHDRDEIESSVTTALQRVDLLEAADHRADRYSRGMRQRLGLASLLIKSPRVMILDEPTLGLDPTGITSMLGLIRSLSHEERITVVLCSHLLHQVQEICDRVGIMDHGRLVAEGTIADLSAEGLRTADERLGLQEIYMRYFREEG